MFNSKEILQKVEQILDNVQITNNALRILEARQSEAQRVNANNFAKLEKLLNRVLYSGEMKNLSFSKACLYALEGRKIKRAHWMDTYIVLDPHRQNWAYAYDPMIKGLVRERLVPEDTNADDWEVLEEEKR